MESQCIRYLVVWECTIKKMQKDSAFESSMIEEIENSIEENKTDRYL